MGFFADIMKSFPKDLQPPLPLIDLFKWVDAQKLNQNSFGDLYRESMIDPSQERSCVCLEPVDLDFSKLWTRSNDPKVFQRLAAFCRTGGDGSYAALWRDDDGITKIVHLGSGSGSTMLGEITSESVDFIRLLAIGYEELCWPEHHKLTPTEVFEHEFADEENPPKMDEPPLKLQGWVQSRFAVSIPTKASEIIGEISDMDAEASDDPFWVWLRSLDPLA